jgi:hypothetical protein
MTLKKLYKQSKKYSDEPIDLNFEIEVFLETKDKTNQIDRQRFSPYFHPSKVSKGISCERWWYYYLSGETGEVAVDSVNAASLLKMNIGTGIHDMMHRLFYDMGILEGVWKCKVCHDEFWAVSPKGTCTNCGNEFKNYNSLEFMEVPLKGDYIRGHADGLINKGNRFLLEIKSIKNADPDAYGNYGFEYLDRPMDEHVIQAMLYIHEWNNKVKEAQEKYFLKLGETGLSLEPDYSPILVGARTIGTIDRAILFYIAKNSAERKIFIVKYDENQIKHLLSTMKNIWNHFLQGDIDGLEHLCLNREECKKKKCRYSTICMEEL